jgi:transposase
MWDVMMRGGDVRTEALFSYLSCEARVPQDHPLRPIRTLVDQALTVLSPAFDRLYSDIGRPSIPPEKLLRTLLLQAFYSVRSERQLMEQLDYNLLFRWFVGLAMDAPIWDVTVFTKNRDRFLAGEVAAQFFRAVLGQPEVRALLSDEHFSVDGTLIEAFASMKSFKPKAEAGGEPAPAQRHARLDHRPRRQALPQGPRQGGQALPHGPPADGEPQRPDRRRDADSGHRHRRARGRRSDAGPPGGSAPGDARRRQGL